MVGSLRLITMVCPLALVITMSWFGIFTFVNAYIVKVLHYSDEQWTQATLWYVGGVIFWQLFTTEISARIGRRRTVTLAMLVSAVGFAVLACTSSFAVICPVLALMGFVIAANAVAWMPLITEAGRERPGRALATSQLAVNIVAAITLVAGGYLSAGHNFTRTFLIISAACAICAVAFDLLTRPLDVVRSKIVTLRHVSRQDVSSLVRSPFLFLMLFGMCLEPFIYHTNNQLFPNLARIAHGLREEQISSIVALGRLPALITLIPLAYHIDRMHGLRWYGVGMICTGISVAVVGGAGSAAMLVIGYVVLYACYGLVWGSNMASVNACIEPRLRDSAFAIVNVVSMGSVFLVGTVHNRMVSAGCTFPTVFKFCGTVGACAGVLLIAYSFSRHYARRGKVLSAEQ